MQQLKAPVFRLTRLTSTYRAEVLKGREQWDEWGKTFLVEETRGRRRSKIGYQIHPKKERRVGHIDGPAIVTFFKAFFFMIQPL